MTRENCADLLDAYEAFTSRTGITGHHTVFFFGVALGATQAKIDSEAIIEAINKLAEKKDTP